MDLICNEKKEYLEVTEVRGSGHKKLRKALIHNSIRTKELYIV